MHLNFSNVEELIFHDRAVQAILPASFFSLFEQWRLAKQFPALRALGKHAILDFLNELNDDHVAALELYFDENIHVERLNYSVTKNIKVPLAEACDALCSVEGFYNFSAWRDESDLHLTFWR